MAKRLAGTVLLLALALAAARSRHPRTAALLARAQAARGGAARLAAIRTLMTSGVLRLPSGRSAQFLVRSRRPNLFSMELQFGRSRVVQGFDGRRAWQVDPGARGGRWLSGADAQQVQNQALGFVDMIAAPRRAGTRVRYAGRGRIGGRRYVALRFTLADGSTFIQYFDPLTALAFWERFPTPTGIGQEKIADYRRVGGVLLPCRYVSFPDSAHPVVVQRLTIRLNRHIPRAVFQRPAPAGHR